MPRTTLTMLVAGLLASFASAQCAGVTSTLVGGNGQSGTMFDIVNVSAAPITVSSFEQVFGVNGGVTVEVYTKTDTYFGSETTAANWTLVGSTPVTAVVGPTLTAIPLGINVSIPAGATQGFYITTTASTCTYTTGVGQLNTVIGSDANINIIAGVGVAYPFGTTFGLPTAGRLWNGRVTYSQGGACQAATSVSTGSSCSPQAFNSFYQLFADATQSSVALSGNTLNLVNTGTGYVGVWSPGTAVTDFVVPVAASVLPTGDDGVVTINPSSALPTPSGPQSTLSVSGNGIIGFGATIDYPGSNSFTPTAGGMLNSVNGGFYAWHDYNSAETGSGPIAWEEIGGVLYVTYNGVENYSATTMPNPSTLQFQFDLTTGDAKIVFVNIDGDATSTFGSALLVGVSAPGTSLDPGSVDLSTATPTTNNPEVPPATLASVTQPITGNTWNLQVDNIPAAAVLGVEVFGVSDPGINDLFFIGMPGCGLRANLDSLNAFLVAGSSHAFALPIPNNPIFIGVDIYSTSALFLVPPTNTFGAVTTNGMAGTIGNY